jgi:DNA replicative helicase MCM subunit Mcm2 (Cdc46/Mcm family)
MIIEDIAAELNCMVRLKQEDWELLLYSALSPYAPDIEINGVMQRGVMHTNMVGEISTAKSSIMRIIEKISPKSARVSKTTNASIEGTVTPGNVIVPGVIERANDGVLLVPEYTKKLSKLDIMRETMDGEKVRISKRAISWDFTPNVAFIAGSNPKLDFFTKGATMRQEIPFAEGILSRFDVLIPMINTPSETEKIVNEMTFFGMEVKKVDLRKIKSKYLTLAESMRALVYHVKVKPSQAQKLRDAYLNHNVEMGNRPRVILRDMGSLIRLVNVITCANAVKRAGKNTYTATAADIDKAIDLWNYLINIRVQMYAMLEEKDIKDTEDLVLDIIKDADLIPNKELIAKASGICSRRTVFRILNRLEADGIIKRVNPDTEAASVELV